MPDDIDYKALSFYLQLANSLGVVLVAIYAWISNRHKANASAIKEVSDSILEDMSVIEARFARIESEIKHLPTHNDMGAVYERINTVAETLSALSGEIRQMNAGLKLIHTHLLSKNGG